MGYIYKIINLVDGKNYIGLIAKSNKSIQDRFKEHCHQAKSNKQSLLYTAIRNFGVENFKIEQLATCADEEALRNLEKFYIKKFNTNLTNGGRGYNMTDGGQGTSGFKWTEESKNKKRKILCVDVEQAFLKDISVLTIGELQEKYDVCSTTLYKWLKTLGMKKPRVKRSIKNQFNGKWSEEEEHTLIKMYKENFLIEDISRKLSRTMTSIVVKLARLKAKFNIKHRRFRNQHQDKKQFKVIND